MITGGCFCFLSVLLITYYKFQITAPVGGIWLWISTNGDTCLINTHYNIQLRWEGSVFTKHFIQHVWKVLTKDIGRMVCVLYKNFVGNRISVFLRIRLLFLTLEVWQWQYATVILVGLNAPTKKCALKSIYCNNRSKLGGRHLSLLVINYL